MLGHEQDLGQEKLREFMREDEIFLENTKGPNEDRGYAYMAPSVWYLC